MEDTKKSSGWAARFRNAIQALMGNAGNTGEAGCYCCGVECERAGRAEDMPTPSSCCGVRM